MPTLVIQQGHCYRRSGATGTAGEQDYATHVADACVRLLAHRSGWSVRAILADDPPSSYGGDAFVAIHCDGSTSSDARGASVGYRTPEGQQLGRAWKMAYERRGWAGFRPDNYTAALAQYYGTGTAVGRGNRRAIIIECGFLTSPADRSALTGPGGVERVALAIGDALGIDTGQDDDMQLDELINFRVTSPADGGKRNLWDFAVQNEVNTGAVMAQLAAIAAAVADGDLDPEAVLARIDRAVREATEHAINGVVAPALREALAQSAVLFDQDLADTILDAVARRLGVGHDASRDGV